VRNVGIYVFDEVEVLDFAGPFEVFSTASRLFCRAQPGAEPPFQVFTVGASRSPVSARGGLVVQPRFSFADHPALHVLLVPGGVVTAELDRPRVIAWVAVQSATAEVTASVCTGAFLLARARLLKGKSATTHWEDIADLRAMAPATRVVQGVRWVEEGSVLTSAGISAGLDMSLHIVARLAGHDLAARTARQMDYEWRDDRRAAPLPTPGPLGAPGPVRPKGQP
jgi:transcriptional regulator GlxA family with amidase domain